MVVYGWGKILCDGVVIYMVGVGGDWGRVLVCHSGLAAPTLEIVPAWLRLLIGESGSWCFHGTLDP